MEQFIAHATTATTTPVGAAAGVVSRQSAAMMMMMMMMIMSAEYWYTHQQYSAYIKPYSFCSTSPQNLRNKLEFLAATNLSMEITHKYSQHF
jgi:hypothetical protein